MKSTSSLKVNAANFGAALHAVVPEQPRSMWRKEPCTVSLDFDPQRSMLRIVEMNFGLGEHTLRASGTWSETVQLDGHILRLLSKKYCPDDDIELVALPDDVSLLHAGSEIVLNRIDSPRRLKKFFEKASSDYPPPYFREELSHRHMLGLSDMFAGWALSRRFSPERMASLLGWAEGLQRLADDVGPSWDPPRPEIPSLIGSLGRWAVGEK